MAFKHKVFMSKDFFSSVTYKIFAVIVQFLS